MSQSDYIAYKKVSNIINLDAHYKQPPVITEQNYTAFKQYNLVNSIVNTKVRYNVLDASGVQDVFGMNKKPEHCPSMFFCQNTHRRSNRVPMSEVYFTPKYIPLTIKATKNAANQKTGCRCVLDSVNTERNVCRCKTAQFGTVR